MKYDFELDLNSNNSLALIAKQITPYSKILEFGPAAGRLTKFLKEQMNCDVFIVEIDEESAHKASQYAKETMIGDIEKLEWLETYKNERFDYIIFADVLEHLYNPQKVLSESVNLLNQEGSILTSVPNVAHNSIIIDLLHNQFKYRTTGLLDDTHVRFFTYQSLKAMIDECNLIAVREDAVIKRVGDTEIRNYFDGFPNEVSCYLKNRQFGDVYQYVFELKKEDAELSPTLNMIGTANYYYNQLYIDTGNGCNEDQSIIIDYSNQQTFEFDLSQFSQINFLRFDPINVNCSLAIRKIIIYDENGIPTEIINFESNADYIINDVYVFLGVDPNIFIDLSGILKKPDKIVFFVDILDKEFESTKLLNSALSAHYELILEQNKLIKENDCVQSNMERVLEDKEDLVKDVARINEEIRMVKEANTMIQSTLQEVTEEKENLIEEAKLVVQEMTKAKECNIELQMELTECNKGNVDLQQRVDNLTIRLNETEEELQAIHSLKMWKLYSKIFLK